MFTLPKTTATLVSVTNRAEKHGEDEVPAVSLGLKIDGPNTLLDSLSPTLRETLYVPTPGQPKPLPGIEPSTPKLRTEGIEYVAGSGVLEGYTVVVDRGIDDETAVVLKACKLDKWRVAPKEGGQIEFNFRAGTSAVDARIMGLLAFKVGQEVSITIKPPKVGTASDDKGDAKAAAKSKKAQAEAEAAGQQRIDAKTPEQALAETQG
jgi:hypothetical protein